MITASGMAVSVLTTKHFGRPGFPVSYSPLLALQASLIDAATGLKTCCTETIDVTDLTPHSALKNAMCILRRTSPPLAYIVDHLGPFAVLGFAVGAWLWKDATWTGFTTHLSAIFRPSIVVPSDDRLHAEVLAWIAGQHSPASRSSRHLRLIDSTSRSSANPDDLSYLPLLQSLPLKYEGHWLTFDQEQPNLVRSSEPGFREETRLDPGDIIISCFSFRGDTRPAENLLKSLQKSTSTQKKSQTLIYKVAKNGSGWARPVSRTSRTLASVVMDQVQKDVIVDDIMRYQNEKAVYTEDGNPYRRGYLLHGPPGTGKTSLVLALAGNFNLPLYILSLSHPDMNDWWLERLFDQLPQKSIIVIEDIDSAGIARENMTEAKTDKESTRTKVTLSALLNAIDGPAAVEGRILVLTSNRANTLDEALVRPGRVDCKVYMGYASKFIAGQLFERACFLKKKAVKGKVEEKEQEVEGTDTAQPNADPSYTSKQEAPEITSLNQLSERSQAFAAKIPEDRFTPAEIQGFCLQHRQDPEKAIELVGKWVEDVIAIKDQGHNVAASDSQTNSPELPNRAFQNVSTKKSATLAKSPRQNEEKPRGLDINLSSEDLAALSAVTNQRSHDNDGQELESSSVWSRLTPAMVEKVNEAGLSLQGQE